MSQGVWGHGCSSGVRVRCRTYANTKEKGDALEARVVRWLRRRGEGGIRRNVVLTDAHGNRSEIDVMCGRVFKTYIECKNYSKPVPLKDVAKFTEASAPPICGLISTL